jgi:CRP/FNR family transcriptional regulator, cyclic AMP receptor protein
MVDAKHNILTNDSPWVNYDGTATMSEKFMLLGTPRFFNKGAFVYQQADYTKEFYCLATGKVKISIFGEDGTEKILAFQEEGTLFGVTSAFDKGPYRETAQVISPSKIYVINVSKTIQAIQTDPTMALCIIRACARRIRLLTSEIERLSFLSAKAHIAQVLAQVIISHGRFTDRGKKLEIHLTHQELADIVSVERSTVTRVLNEFRKMGIVEKDKWELIVVDEQKLKQIAEGKVSEFNHNLPFEAP